MDLHHVDRESSRLALWAGRTFLRVEFATYFIVGVAFLAVAVLGLVAVVMSLWTAIKEFGDAGQLVLAIDRLLLVLMVVEILHTVRGSLNSGKLTCEPFLIVGLIASIRRMLVITLESSQENHINKMNAEPAAVFSSTMMELSILAGLILVMVVSITLLRHSENPGPKRL